MKRIPRHRWPWSRLKPKDSSTVVIVVLLGVFTLGMLLASREHKPYKPIVVSQPGNP